MKVITKYFSRDVESILLNGSFKFGTLENYAKSENEQERFSDRREGVVQHHYQCSHGGTEIRWGTTSIKIGLMLNNAVDVAHDIHCNDFIFCASDGGYDRNHHRLMIEGCTLENGEHYRGNADLTNFVVINLNKFCAGVKSELIRRDDCSGYLRNPLCFQKINYGKSEIKNKIGLNVTLDNTPLSNWYFKTVFTKPARFSPEREFRILIGGQGLLPMGTDALYLQNGILKKSIVSSGSI